MTIIKKHTISLLIFGLFSLMSCTEDDEPIPNTAPTILNTVFSVPENSPENQLVGDVDADDPDGDVLRFNIYFGNKLSEFKINQSTG